MTKKIIFVVCMVHCVYNMNITSHICKTHGLQTPCLKPHYGCFEKSQAKGHMLLIV